MILPKDYIALFDELSNNKEATIDSACKKLGISRASLYRVFEKDPRYKKKLREVIETSKNKIPPKEEILRVIRKKALEGDNINFVKYYMEILEEEEKENERRNKAREIPLVERLDELADFYLLYKGLFEHILRRREAQENKAKGLPYEECDLL